MTTALRRVAAYVGSAHVEQALRGVLERQHALRVVPMTAFQRFRRVCLVSLVVMDLNDPAVDVADSLLEIRSRWPAVPVVGYAPPETGPTLMSSLPDMISSGITVITDWRGGAFDQTIARILQTEKASTGMSNQFENELLRIDSPWVEEFCRTCLDLPFESSTVDVVARRIGVTRQHIAAEFQRVGIGSPGRFVTLARLVHAVNHVVVQGVGWGETADALQWSSAAALRRALQRRTGLTAATGMTAYGRGHVHALVQRVLCGTR